ncbi:MULTISPECIES: proteasome-activating nucleotidase [Archaeoglobus]|jgi:proteasome regulatory subunit|uniref:Proteasome-activating nucleotidase n=2 Tax=Archaeoglobus fulgidus TaxID=2234 RepID=PAN_ARCFU|nr:MULTISPECIES: proteasome-activating nucleotidase [Archaeoglobus]O28303.1 RecName: Full=Proteasome-activating nucleotidase; Short=PAN; AltName: Full=Proteasomal ATPase; AltName: Full=Proteasome regulatory ATPase; AltName: Full=Proteasome regulatory particle [Archaeoglobus fulgidus DSM 4304]AAB89280.1 26S protease regulatory subunit 4 [Archaeoglobus fulgidus DSM 4304]AIG98967.1 26S proteasome subunit P45 family [Archaeoglobus fulgidus DSM 8774]MDI3497796.1 proteasome regulatory subunit [Archae
MGDSEIQYLLEKLKKLEEDYYKLRELYRRLEDEKKFIESERIRYEREVRRLRSEVERLRSPPLLVGVVSDILEDGRVVVKSSTGPKFVVNTSQYINEEELKPGARVALNQQTLAIVNVLPTSKDPMVYGFEVEEKPEVSYEDIGGLDVQIEEIREAVELPLLKPELFAEVGIEPPKGVLLYGPPGTGKTLLAKAVANQTRATFIRVVGSEFVQKYIGEGARLVREVFQLAKEKAPSIIFIDELDAIAARRTNSDTSGDREVQRTMMQLLAELDGFDPRGDVKVIGATNRIDILDPAILRPGRFDRIIEVPLPTFEGRIQIFKIHTRKMKLAEDVDFKELARITEGASGADIKAICTEAGMFAIREERAKVTMLDFTKAIEKVLKKTTPIPDLKGVMFV